MANQVNTMLASHKNTNAERGFRCQRLVVYRRSAMTIVILGFCYSLILLSIFQCSESSVAPTSLSSRTTKSTTSKTRRKKQPTPQREKHGHLQPSSPLVRNLFKSERTVVSGFGSRSTRKTVFAHRSSKQRRIKKEGPDDKNSYGEHAEDDFLPAMESTKMWVQRPSRTGGNKEDDVLWVLLREENTNVEDENNNKVVLKLTFDDEVDDWVAKKATPREELDFVRDHPLDEWIPVEGLYGSYRVPTGVLWVLITGTEAVYEAPPISSTSSPWWQIRRVTNLEIVHLGNKGYHSPEAATTPPTLRLMPPKSALLTVSRLREEVRQIRLLRNALKQHDFYYVPSGTMGHDKGGDNPGIIRDMSKSLQRSILENNDSLPETKHPWWKALDETEDGNGSDPMPDPRFFWNQHAVEPMLRRYLGANGEAKSDQQRKQIAGLLLQHAVPLTSAFVGVQKNITVTESASSSSSSSLSSSPQPSISYDEILISRRSRFRAGTRFTVRGADASGDVANFAETEQICLTTSTPSTPSEEGRYLRSVASHVQTRGSIPLRWSSPADVKTYRPRVNIGADPLAQARALRLHVLDQLEHYALSEKTKDRIDHPPGKGGSSSGTPKIIFVNLVDKHSDQGRLGRAFDEVLKAVVDVHANESSSHPPIASSETTGENSAENALSFSPSKLSAKIGADSLKHVWYDFHAEVKNGRWDRLGLLLDEVQPSLTSHGYFMAHPVSRSGDEKTKSKGWSIQRLQNAVVRTNCMDCLDRTNVVQSIFGRYMLFEQLSNEAGESSIESKPQSLWANMNQNFREKSLKLPWETGEVAHRLLWADNADAISRLYAGTPALKGDFTRTGKRTKKGALDDGMNSLQRYYLNNFLDADRQEGYDLLVGHVDFSNVLEEESSVGDDDDETTGAYSPKSILGATRENILSDVIKGSSFQDRKDLRKRLEEIGVSRKPDLDLRWLPGDLQTQVRDQASGAPSINGKNDVDNAVTLSSEKRKKGVLYSHQAMKAIDERSHVELPWWSKSDGDWLELGPEDDIAQESMGLTINQSSQHRNQVILTPFQLAVVFYLGLKAPTLLGGLTLAILSYVYLPDCLKQDYQQQKILKSFIGKQLNKKNET